MSSNLTIAQIRGYHTHICPKCGGNISCRATTCAGKDIRVHPACPPQIDILETMLALQFESTRKLFTIPVICDMVALWLRNQKRFPDDEGLRDDVIDSVIHNISSRKDI